MSVGVFLGIRPSFNDQVAARDFLEAIKRALARADLPSYDEPPEVPRIRLGAGVGRSALDHHSASALAALAEREEHAQHLGLVASNPYRVVFLPFDFATPLETIYRELVAGRPTPIWVGSASRLADELRDLAGHFGIRLEGGELSDHVAAAINESQPLSNDDENAELFEDERTTWLLLYEGARLAVTHGIALSLAG